MKFLKFSFLFLVLAAVWTTLALYLAFEGAWQSPVVGANDHDAFRDWAVSELVENNKGTVAMVLLENGQLAHEFFHGPDQDVNRDTLFPTASFSKFIAAIGVLRLVDEGKLELDQPVDSYLERWSLPATDFDNNEVTVRRLLSHTSGLTDGLGFGDYRADETLPDIITSLNNPRSSGNATEIKVGVMPGSEFIYSGGGYLVLELVVEEVTGQDFADYIRQGLLEPLGMTRSGYAYLAELENVSASYNQDGTTAPTFRYASRAATAFSSSADDLSKLALALMNNEKKRFLGVETMSAMRTPEAFVMGAGIWGPGAMLYSKTPAGDFVYGHDGANEPAINASLRINPDTSDAIIVLVSGHPSLASRIGSEWTLWQTGYPDFLATEQTIRSAILPILIGIFVIFVGITMLARKSSRKTA